MALLRWALGGLLLTVAGVAAVLVFVGTASFTAVAALCGAASAAAFTAAWVRARRAARVPPGRRCLECGAAVPTAAVCPWCQGVTIAVTAAPGGGAVRGHSALARDLPVGAYSSDRSGVIGWVDVAPPEGAGAGALRGLRGWGAGLLVGAGFFAMLAIAEASGAWLLAVSVFVAAVAGSALLVRIRL